MMKNNLMNPLRALALFAVVIGLVFTTSCGEDDEPGEPEPTMTTIEIIKANPDYSDFVQFYELNSSILPDLSTSTEFTVFVPNNNAFSKLKATLKVDDLTSVKQDVIAAVLAFHFVSGTETEITAGSSYATAQGESVVVNADGTIETGGSDKNVEILTSEAATNGYVYEVGTILIPPVQIFAVIVAHLDKVSQTILLGADFSILADIIDIADEGFADVTEGVTPLKTLLSGDVNTYTVLAPTNATFQAAAGITAEDDAATAAAKLNGFIANFTAQQFYGIVANHVIVKDEAVVVGPADMTTGASFATAAGGTLTFYQIADAGNYTDIFIDSDDNFDGQTASLLNAEVALPNAVVSGNGTIHVVAGLLTP